MILQNFAMNRGRRSEDEVVNHVSESSPWFSRMGNRVAAPSNRGKMWLHVRRHDRVPDLIFGFHAFAHPVPVLLPLAKAAKAAKAPVLSPARYPRASLSAVPGNHRNTALSHWQCLPAVGPRSVPRGTKATDAAPGPPRPMHVCMRVCLCVQSGRGGAGSRVVSGPSWRPRRPRRPVSHLGPCVRYRRYRPPARPSPRAQPWLSTRPGRRTA